MRFFHASTHEFVFPDYEKIRDHMTGHANGMLGLWVAVQNDWITGFGGVIYEVELGSPAEHSAPKVVDLSIETLTSWKLRDEHFHAARRDEFLADSVDYLRLVEIDGSSKMGVVVNFNAIKSFVQLDPEVVKEAPKRDRCAP